LQLGVFNEAMIVPSIKYPKENQYNRPQTKRLPQKLKHKHHAPCSVAPLISSSTMPSFVFLKLYVKGQHLNYGEGDDFILLRASKFTRIGLRWRVNPNPKSYPYSIIFFH